MSSSHNAITIYDSFRTPFLEMTSHGPQLQPKVSGTDRADTTMLTPPPRIWFPISERAYVEAAESQLSKKKMAHDLSISFLPSPETPLCLASESDVVRASALYLLHPVMKALQSVIPGATCSAEVAETGVRCDVLVRVSNVTIAVLEYKNRGYMARRDFLAGVVEDCTERNKAEILNKLGFVEKNVKTYKRGLATLLDGNAPILSKQAGAYATRFLTKYVALFDWDNLFLWYFAGMEIVNSHKSVHNRWAYGTWVERRDTFRVALLGFFLKAYSAKVEKGARYNHPSWDPWVPSPAEQERRRREYEAKQKNGEAYARRW